MPKLCNRALPGRAIINNKQLRSPFLILFLISLLLTPLQNALLIFTDINAPKDATFVVVFVFVVADVLRNCFTGSKVRLDDLESRKKTGWRFLKDHFKKLFS